MTKHLKLCLLTSLLLITFSFHLDPQQSYKGNEISQQYFNFEKKVNLTPNFNDDEKKYRKNPTRREIFTYMCEIGKKYNLPPEILERFPLKTNNGTEMEFAHNGSKISVGKSGKITFGKTGHPSFG